MCVAVSLAAVISSVAALALMILTLRSALEASSAESSICAVVGLCFFLALTRSFWIGVRDQCRVTVLRWRGRTHVTLDDGGASRV